MKLLEGKTVLITGAGSNVGRAVARLFAEHGGRLALADLELLDPGSGAAASPPACRIQADLTSAAETQRMVERTVAELGSIDVLCNTLGIDPPTATTTLETSEADWDRIMTVNLKAVFLSCKAALGAMQAQGRGVIVNVASQGALRALPAMTAYGVSKAGVLQLTRQIAADHAAQGIRANCVCPSGLASPSRDRLAGLDAEGLARRAAVMEKAAPLGRVCQPEDVAGAMLFLASDLSGYVTGAALPVEGGTTMALRF
jgi:NAD(P)-dependent dehydrogenase (short-subunit alcohol dehydrogenase family)